MRTPVDQVELFFSRAVELEKRAVDKHEGKLKETLLTLAAYYRELSKQAQQTKPNRQTIQMQPEARLRRQFVAGQLRQSSRLRLHPLSR
jgi:hypothetical protein